MIRFIREPRLSEHQGSTGITIPLVADHSDYTHQSTEFEAGAFPYSFTANVQKRSNPATQARPVAISAHTGAVVDIRATTSTGAVTTPLVSRSAAQSLARAQMAIVKRDVDRNPSEGGGPPG